MGQRIRETGKQFLSSTSYQIGTYVMDLKSALDPSRFKLRLSRSPRWLSRCVVAISPDYSLQSPLPLLSALSSFLCLPLHGHTGPSLIKFKSTISLKKQPDLTEAYRSHPQTNFNSSNECVYKIPTSIPGFGRRRGAN